MYEERYSSHEGALRTDYGRWPLAVRQLAIAPLAERFVSLDELQAFCRKDRAPRPRWVVPDLGQPLFAKIAVVSWKCFPWLLPAHPGLDLGRFCSERMRRVLRHWLEAQAQPVLRFFPLVDYREVAEIRVRLQRESMTFERRIGQAGDASASHIFRRAQDLLADVRLQVDNVRVDIAVPRQQARPAWLVEINPLQPDRRLATRPN